ncbi:hypothetical protein GWI33_010071 [Rhynchophorus ferrugineus]|uniref:EngC GTPase domain-containing protein n=1 Tax=Rhynchophorus ferrugineus TaxID=354439 RepID=A0A834IDC6_RHYFE|nr:hypothetical protein GWI33_010071 [Rhynchophorus ferrugineus]
MISENSSLGQHTTTSTRLIQFPNAVTHGKHGALIDSPGIREFGLWHLSSQNILAGFPEFEEFYGLCQFRNCTHQHEKKCALRDAAIDGKILQRRLDSMNRLLNELNDAEKS